MGTETEHLDCVATIALPAVAVFSPPFWSRGDHVWLMGSSKLQELTNSSLSLVH